MDLSKKTPWHLAINGGMVPIVELPDGTIINDSKIILEYLEEAYPESGYPLLPKDPVERALLRLAIPASEEVVPSFYAVYMNHSLDEEQVKTYK